MTIASPYRPFLVLAPAHLAAWGVMEGASVVAGQDFLPWDAQIWLLLTGFIGFMILGFFLHLFPPLFHRALPKALPPFVLFPVAEGAVVLGVLGSSGPPAVLLVARLLWTVVSFLVPVATLAGLRKPARTSGIPAKTCDRVVLPLAVTSVLFLPAAALAWTASVFWVGPGLGFWVAGIHLYLLGQVVLLIMGVSFHLVPRALADDLPAWLVHPLPPLAIAGALLVPSGMMLLPFPELPFLGLLALPEVAAGMLYASGMALLVARARAPKPAALLFLAAPLFLLLGGGVGLAMAGTGDFAPMVAHALIGILGFAGIMIMGMAFSMLAPFQYISHAWTIRVLRGELLLLGMAVASVLLVVGDASLAPAATLTLGASVAIAGLLLLAGAAPVLYHREPRR